MAIIPALRTWIAGEIITAAMLNTNIRDAISFVLAPPAAALRQTVAQSLTNNGWTSINFDTEDVDNDGAHSTVSNPSRYTAQTPGWHRVNGGMVGFAGGAGRKGTRLAVNGSEVLATQVIGYVSGAASVTQVVVGRDVYLNAGDYLEVQAFQESGGPLNTLAVGSGQSGVTIAWVRS